MKWFFCLLFLMSVLAQAQQSAPIIFFTDLIAGPTTGNSDTSFSSTGGVYVTLYGNFFDNYTSVKLNNAACLSVVSAPATWLWYERMIVKLGTSCTSGNFSITTPGGTWSGPTVATVNAQTLLGGDNWPTVDFTVSSGKIHYLNYQSGNDNNAGTFSSPWQHAYHALDVDGTSTGNVDYFMAGTYLGDNDDWGAYITPRPQYSMGTATQPNAMVGYPGQTAQIGQEDNSNENTIRTTDTDSWTTTNNGYWTFAELTLRAGDNGGGPVEIAGGSQSFVSRGWRLVALDVSSPTAGNNATTPFQLNLTSYNQVFGNYDHDLMLESSGQRLNQALYLSTDANYVDLGWNEIYNMQGRAGLQVHSSPLCYPSCNGDTTGFPLHDLWLHDNIVNTTANECILVDTPAPSIGNGIRLYNNVAYNCGTVNGANFATGWEYSGDPCTIGKSPAPMWWYNNTVYDTSTNVPSLWGDYLYPAEDCGGTLSINNQLSNNIYQTSGTLGGVIYVDAEMWGNDNPTACSSTASPTQCIQVAGTNNLEYGMGAATFTNLLTGTINHDALFVNASGGNFQLQSGSPAIGAGTHTITNYTGSNTISAPLYDINGLVRPNPPSIGAFEFASGTSTSSGAPMPPTGLTASVN
jgi:hypothetical protein